MLKKNSLQIDMQNNEKNFYSKYLGGAYLKSNSNATKSIPQINISKAPTINNFLKWFSKP